MRKVGLTGGGGVYPLLEKWSVRLECLNYEWWFFGLLALTIDKAKGCFEGSTPVLSFLASDIRAFVLVSI